MWEKFTINRICTLFVCVHLYFVAISTPSAVLRAVSIKFFFLFFFLVKKEICECLRGKFGCLWDFPGGIVVKNPPANAGDMGSISGPGRSHMPRSN